MSDRVALLRLLGRVRRRMRLSGALQGAVLGATAFLGAWAALLATGRLGLTPAPAPSWLAALAGAAVIGGALVGLLRAVPLARCARAVDAAVGRSGAGEARNGDRTVAALALLAAGERPGTVPFVEAAIRDALRAAGPLAPSAAAPLRRPRGLGAAGSLAVAAAALAWWPAPPTPASAARPAAAAQPGNGAERIDPEVLAADRERAARAARQAAELADPELARLAAELAELVAALEAEGLDPGEALERLAALERRAAEAAGAASALRRALEAAGEALSREARTRALGEAMRQGDAEGGQKALDALADRAAQDGARDRERIAQALERAAAAARAAGGGGGEPQARDERQQRRLSREQAQADRSGERAERSQDRQLRRLERNLDEGADRCREDPEACKEALGQTASELPEMMQEAERAAAREQVGRAAGQLRERLRRLDSAGGRGERSAERSFERAAEGRPAGPRGEGPRGEGPRGEGQGDGELRAGETGGGQPTPAPGGGPPGESGAPSEETAVAEGGGAAGVVAGADGVGQEAGDDPLGRRTPLGARGELREARVRSGAGPTRAEVIEAGARRGFAHGEYERVFQDYSAVVEETLDTTAVPAGRRYLVRRYFELIRPRPTRQESRP